MLGAVPQADLGPARAPGMLAAHYAPRARVELCADDAALGARASVLIDAGERALGAVLPAGAVTPLPPQVTVLARPPSAAAYARDLYALLRAADERAITTLLVVPPDAAGVGLAVRDRLARAATATVAEGS